MLTYESGSVGVGLQDGDGYRGLGNCLSLRRHPHSLPLSDHRGCALTLSLGYHLGSAASLRLCPQSSTAIRSVHWPYARRYIHPP
jgi:hypothetical protein